MLHAGLDLSRRKLDICLPSDQGEHLDQLIVPPDVGSLKTLARRIEEVHRKVGPRYEVSSANRNEAMGALLMRLKTGIPEGELIDVGQEDGSSTTGRLLGVTGSGLTVSATGGQTEVPAEAIVSFALRFGSATSG
jgi:hypothetical protein